MFERLSVRATAPNDAFAPLDLGALVEAAVFYGDIRVVLTPNILRQLVRTWGRDALVTLLDSEHLRFALQANFSGVRVDHSGTGRERYSPMVFEIHDQRGFASAEELSVGRALAEELNRGSARRLTKQVLMRVEMAPIEHSLQERVISDVLDPSLVEPGVRTLLAHFAPGLELDSRLRFAVQEIEKGELRILTNVNFDLATNVFRQLHPGTDISISPAYLLAHFMTSREIMEDAQRSGADIFVDPIQSKLGMLRVASIINRATRHQSNIERFQSFVMNDGRTIREAVNSGHSSFAEILRLLDRAAEFRHWIAGQPADADLVKAYFQEVTRESWVDRLPSKAMRWLFFTGAGAAVDAAGAGGAGLVAGLAISAWDALLLDKIVKGWRPDQFVESSMAPFVRNKGRQ